MKQLIFVGNQKGFNALRLGVRLAQLLQAGGREIVLGGIKGKLPNVDGIATVTVGATASAKTLAAAFEKAGAERVIALGSLPACEAAGLIKLPYIYVEPENFKEAKAVKNKKAILKKAKKVIVLGNSTKALDKKMYSSNAVRIQNPAIWVEHFQGARPGCFKKPNNVVATGSFAKGEGLDDLLKVWAVLSPLHPTWHLTVAGEGAGKTTLARFVAKNNLQDSTELLGAEADLAALLAHADIFVRPEVKAAEEVLDALASKLPVLAADTQEAQSFITHASNGYLVPAGDGKAWQTALDELMVDWGKRVGLALEAAKLRDRFPLEVFVSFFED